MDVMVMSMRGFLVVMVCPLLKLLLWLRWLMLSVLLHLLLMFKLSEDNSRSMRSSIIHLICMVSVVLLVMLLCPVLVTVMMLAQVRCISCRNSVLRSAVAGVNIMRGRIATHTQPHYSLDVMGLSDTIVDKKLYFFMINGKI